MGKEGIKGYSVEFMGGTGSSYGKEI